MFQPDVFIENLRKLRKQRGLSQGDLARELFVSTQAISKWERGEAVPDIARICQLSELFGVTMDHLLGNTTQEESAPIAVDGGGTVWDHLHELYQKSAYIASFAPCLKAGIG